MPSQLKLATSFFSLGLLMAGRQDTSGTVQGSVTHAVTMEGIAGARVEVCPPRPDIGKLMPERSQVGVIRIGDGGIEVRDKEGEVIVAAMDCPLPIRTTTDEVGRFTVRELKPGNYVLKATRNGYTQTVPSRNPEIVTTSFTISANASPVDVGLLRMVRAGTISGIVFDDQGRAIPNALVAAVLPDALDPARSQTVQVAQTDDRGGYRLVGLPPGTYFVSAAAQSISAEPGSLRRTVFYPSASTLTDARPIVVVEGNNISAMNITWRAR
jgi:hypothetical protein